jgi:hypothetical protein
LTATNHIHEKSFVRALRCDGILSSAQLKSYFNATRKDVLAAKGYAIPAKTTYTYYGTAVKRFVFYSLSKTYCFDRPTALRHLAGLAAMRHSLAAPENEWTIPVTNQRKHGLPDGLWHRGEELVAIEFDAGGYNRSQIVEKAMNFSSYHEQVWGTQVPGRKAHLETLLKGLGVRFCVLEVAWS